MSTNTEHIQGMTVFERLGELDASLIAEAEVDAAYLPLTRAEKKAARRARREARGESGFFQFVNTGWGAAIISLPVALCVLVGIIHAVNHLPPPAEVPGPGGPAGEEIPASGDILLPGLVPFAAEPADFTISTDLMIPEGAKSLTATVTSREEGTDLRLYHHWSLECLTDVSWSGMTITTEEAIEVPAREGEKASCQKKISLSLGLVPGLYRLHAMEHDGEKYRSVAFCEFAVDNEEGYYKTWTEADLEPYASPDVVLTISTDEKIQYGAREITVTFKGEKGQTGLCFPAACRLVKLSDSAAETPVGAGAAFAIADDSLAVGIEAGLDAGADLSTVVPTTTQTYQILNPAAVTPGRYRIYNRDHLGFVYATCEFEVVGDPVVQMGWPGSAEDSESATDAPTEPGTEPTPAYPEAAERPYTITATIGPGRIDTDHTYLTIHYTGAEKGATLSPTLEFAVQKISGEPDDTPPQIPIQEYGLEPVAPAPDEYATLSDSRRIENPADMKPGVYRVYALTYDRSAYIDYYDVVWPGYGEESVSFTISTDYDTFPYGGDTITVIYRATEPGVAFTMGSMTLTRLSDGQEFVLDQPEDDDLLVPEDPDEYLEYRRTFWIADAESLTEGNYRLTATVRGQAVAMTDIYVVLPLPG